MTLGIQIALGLAAVFASAALVAGVASVAFNAASACLSKLLEQPGERRADLNETRHSQGAMQHD